MSHVDISLENNDPLTRQNSRNKALTRRNRMARNTSTTKNKRTNRNKSNRGRMRSSEMTDQELLTSAWAQLRNKPKTDSSGCFRARYPGNCPRCEKRIAVGQEIHRVADYDGYVHFKCKPEVLEGGKAHTVTVRGISKVPNICRQCNTEHAGPCW
jgi:hypothetical protein